jgi:hypothetical protein
MFEKFKAWLEGMGVMKTGATVEPEKPVVTETPVATETPVTPEVTETPEAPVDTPEE